MTNTVTITNRELGGLSGEEEVKRRTSESYRAAHPEPKTEAQIAETETALERAKAVQDAAQDKLDQTKPYLTRREIDTSIEPTIFDKAIGYVAAGMGIMLMCVIPAISTMLIVEAGDIALVADNPVFGFAFGIAALAGALASAQYRDTIGSDAALARYDQRLIRWTQFFVVAWISIAALTAYPIGGDAASDVWSLEAGAATETAFEMPQALLFVVTALLDMSAAAVAHVTAHRYLIGGYLVSTSPNPRHEAQAEHLRQCQARADQHTTTLKDLKETGAAWHTGEAACVEGAVSRYHALQAKAKAAAAKAHEQVLRGLHDDLNDDPADPASAGPFASSSDPDDQLH